MVLGHTITGAPGPALILDRVRTGNYPSAGDSAGNRLPIPLGNGEVLLEPTYALFLKNGLLAVLVGGDGPHPQRIGEYIREKLALGWYLEPVLRDDLDEVLNELRITELQVSIPAELINRELVGGDWYEALESASRLASNGIVRIGMSIGRRGNREFKARMNDYFHAKLSELRQAAGLTHFQSAKVHGEYRGNPQVVDLIQDRLVLSVEVDEERMSDPDEAVSYATEVLMSEVRNGPFAEHLHATRPQISRQLPFSPLRSHE